MDDARDDWERLLSRGARQSRRAIELSALSEPELPALLRILRSRSAPFDFVSVHAPTKNRTVGDRQLVQWLLPVLDRIDSVVFHPDAIDDPEALEALGPKLAIENMDSRKQGGQTADQLEPLMDSLPEARLCFDVAHAGSVDHDMDAGAEILDRYWDRLSHVHLSSLDDRCHHVPITSADLERFWPLLARCRDLPWILEAPLQKG